MSNFDNAVITSDLKLWVIIQNDFSKYRKKRMKLTIYRCQLRGLSIAIGFMLGDGKSSWNISVVSNYIGSVDTI